ncbi:MAG: hypothetical protein PW735_00140 [Acidobacteriaceae bacterium]|nr:hypothetical protein [Acidobacteriaceae bacterium]
MRPRHFACLLLLLSTLAATCSQPAQASRFTGSYIDVLLLRHAVEARRAEAKASATAPCPLQTHKRPEIAALTPQAHASTRIVWTPRPPASHTARVHAFAGLPQRA